MSWKSSVEEEQRDGGRGVENPTDIDEDRPVRGFLMDTFYMLDLNKQQRMLGNICLLPATNSHNFRSHLASPLKRTKVTGPGQNSVGASKIRSTWVAFDWVSSFQFAPQRSPFEEDSASGPKAALPSVTDRHLNTQASLWVFHRSFPPEDLQTLGNKSKCGRTEMIDAVAEERC